LNTSTNGQDPAADHPAGPEAVRWSWPRAFLLGWCRPQSMAAGITRATALGCFAFHLIAFAATLAILAFVIAYAEGKQVPVEFAWILDEFDRNAVLATLVVLGNFLAIEVGMVVLGVLLAAWGARDEPLRTSMGFGLRRVWLCSTFGIMPIVVIGSSIGGANRWRIAQLERLLETPPSFPSEIYQNQLDFPGDAEAQARYDEAQATFHEKRWDYVQAYQGNAQKYMFKYKDEIIALTVLSSICLVGWTLLRVVAAPRPSRAPPRDPTCEWCGYNLTMIPMASRCPECGRPVIESLGDAVRPGTIWDRREELKTPHPWLRTIADVVSSAQSFGRAIQLTTHKTAHRWFLLRSLAFVGSFAYACVIAVSILESGVWTKVTWDEKVFIAFLVGPIVAMAAVVGNLLLVLAAAVLANLNYWRQDRRNLLPAAIKMASYASGFLVLCSLVFCTVCGVIYFLVEFRYFGVLERLTGIRSDVIGTIIFLAPNLVCLLMYLRIVFAGTGSTRYANR